jgi:hypothetical protein
MKRLFRNILFLLIVMAIIIGLAPKLLILEEVQQKITAQLNVSLNSSVTIRNLHWEWLPLPHMLISDTRITNDEIDITLPETRVYPHWSLLLGKTQKPGRVSLLHPVIHIKKNLRLGEGVPELIMPEGRIDIENGTLQIDITDKYQDILQSDSLIFDSVQAKMRLHPDNVGLVLQLKAPFSDNPTISLWIFRRSSSTKLSNHWLTAFLSRLNQLPGYRAMLSARDSIKLRRI